MQTVMPAYHRDRQRGENRDRPRWGPSAAIVQQIMEAHGGVVESKNNSTPGCDLASRPHGCLPVSAMAGASVDREPHNIGTSGILVPGARPVTCTPADPAFPKTTLNSVTQHRHRNRTPEMTPNAPTEAILSNADILMSVQGISKAFGD
jgi:hypothetical protein